jgi:intein-encoded DNA endonuclease-like protein
MQLYAPVRELAGLGLSYRQIRDAVLKAHQVRLSKSTISVWVNGLHDPTGRLNSFRPNPTPELAYVIGVILGDGNLNIHGYNAEMILAVTDHDFAEEFSRCLAIVLQRDHPYTVRWHARKNRWVVQGSSILLHKFLNCDWKSFKKWIEHCDKCTVSFLKAFYDGEGCISNRSLTVYNSRREVLKYIQNLLGQLHIDTSPLHKTTSAGTKLTDPRSGRIYVRKKRLLLFRSSSPGPEDVQPTRRIQYPTKTNKTFRSMPQPWTENFSSPIH